MSLMHGRAIVPTPGTPMALYQSPLAVSKLTVCALQANTTSVFVGTSSVRARTGEANAIPLNGGTRPDMQTFGGLDLSTVYVDAVTANDGITWVAET